jgi:hypothetical protein
MSDARLQRFTRWRWPEIQEILIAVGQKAERLSEKQEGRRPTATFCVHSASAAFEQEESSMSQKTVFTKGGALSIIRPLCLVLGFVSIAASIAIWNIAKEPDPAHGERFGIFVGLWAPTFFILASQFRRATPDRTA